MGFKEDADFARFLSMGAIGTAAVAEHLGADLGHAPVELERYAMANKVWQTKVKRLRLPDLVCTRCGVRVESRAKSALSLVLSHSDTPGREWDGGGMRDRDLFAFIRVELGSSPPRVGAPAYFETLALRQTVGLARRSAPKAASEGSEVTLKWPSWVPGRSGRVMGIDADGRVVCQWDDGRTYRYGQWRKWGGDGNLYVTVGDHFIGGGTFVAGVVEEPSTLSCPGETWDLAGSIQTLDDTERYAAVKVAGLLDRNELTPLIVSLAQSNDWRLRLEAYGSLARLEPASWTDRIAEVAVDEGVEPEQRMEAVFLLSEIPISGATSALGAIAGNRGLGSEVRAAAAWGIGQGAAPRVELLLPLVSDDDPLVALHAITAIEQITDDQASELVALLGAEPRVAAGAARVLQRLGCVEELLDAFETGGTQRLWALRALGDLPPDMVRERAGSRLTDELAELLAPLWAGQNDWLRSAEGEDGLDSLDIQKIRANPSAPWTQNH